MGDPEVDQQRYMQVIENKTAKLFEAACRLAAIISEKPVEIENALAIYGNRLGAAFQITDDVLDYNGNAETMGKNAGDDLAEGKPTLPLIIARQRCSQKERELLDAAISNGGVDDLDSILLIIRDTDSLDAAMAIAKAQASEASQAIQTLPSSQWRNALEQLADYSVGRDH
jgi:octaprenyl-diphosphate synthase